MVKIIIFLNGEYNYSENYIKNLISEEDIVFCADGGANYSYKYNITPKYIVGDLDSIREDVINFYKKKDVIFEKYPKEKDYTDFELILNKIRTEYFDCSYKIYVLGGLGKRIDMTLSNLALMEEHKNLIFLSEKEEIFFIEKSTEICNKKGKIFSIILLDEKVENLTLKGFEYELKDEVLERKKSRLVSNVITKNRANIDFKRGKMLIILGEKEK